MSKNEFFTNVEFFMVDFFTFTFMGLYFQPMK